MKIIKDENGVIEFIYKIVTAITLLIMFITLKDNIETRNSAYLPQLEIEIEDENSSVVLKWKENTESVNEKYTQVNMKLINIGNGNANDVSIEFDEKVLEEWVSTLSQINPDRDYDYLLENNNLKIDYSYVLVGTEEAKVFQVPSIYWECLREICIEAKKQGEEIELPGVNFKVSCFDIQSNPIKYKYELNFINTINGAMKSNSGDNGEIMILELQENGKQNSQNIKDMIKVLIYALAISFQVSGVLLLFLVSTSVKRLDVIKQFVGKGSIAYNENIMELQYDEAAFKDEYETCYLKKIAYFNMGFGCLFSVLGTPENVSKIFIIAEVILLSFAILSLTFYITDRVIKSLDNVNQKITFEEVKKAGVKPDIDSTPKDGN